MASSVRVESRVIVDSTSSRAGSAPCTSTPGRRPCIARFGHSSRHPTLRQGEAKVDATVLTRRMPDTAHAGTLPSTARAIHAIRLLPHHQCTPAWPALERQLQRDAGQQRLRLQSLAWPCSDALARGSHRRRLGQLPAAARRRWRRGVVRLIATVWPTHAGRHGGVRLRSRQLRSSASQSAQRAGRGRRQRCRYRTAPTDPEQSWRPRAHALADLVRRTGTRPDRRRQRASGVLQDVRANRVGCSARHAAGHPAPACEQRGRSVGGACTATAGISRRRRART